MLFYGHEVKNQSARWISTVGSTSIPKGRLTDLTIIQDISGPARVERPERPH